MAKELPYFKFEPNQWDNGNIQMLNRNDKGLFIDLCSMYWSRVGDVPLKLAVQKLCGGNATALDSLIQDKIITVIDGSISIEFLNEQLSEFEDTSKQNSKNARLGWEKRRKNATASNPQSESDAIREEKRREEERRREKEGVFMSVNKIFDSLKGTMWIETTAKNNNLDLSGLTKKLEEFTKLCIDREDGVKSEKEFKKHFVNWLRKNKPNGNDQKSNVRAGALHSGGKKTFD